MIEASLNIQSRLKMHQIVADAIATKDPVLDQDPDNTLLGLVKEKFMPWKRGQHISYLERWLSYAA